MDETLPPRKPFGSGSPPSPTPLDTNETRSLPNPSVITETRDRLGSYIIEAKIGEGGMGKVFRCFDPSLKRPVAIKVLHDKYSRDEYYRARFRREAETLASLSHTSIAQIFAIDSTNDGAFFIVMEYVQGRSIDDILRMDGTLPTDKAIELTRQIAEGLLAAFEKGVIHRDIKPSNLLLRPDGHVKIVDFGLSKNLTGSNTITDEGIVLGTPHYLSPEQGRGLAVDERSDIYSLGSTLYHMVTGVPPFEGKSQIAVIVSHFESDPRPPHEVRPALPESLTHVIGHMMARDPGKRYTRYDEIISDLECLANKQTPLHAVSESGRFGTASSHRLARRATVALLTIVLLVVGIVGGWLVAKNADGPTKFSHASRLGSWYRSRQDGGAVFDFDFARPPASHGNPLDEAFLLPASSIQPPDSASNALRSDIGLRGEVLSWGANRAPLTCRYPFKRLDEVQLLLDRLSGRHVDATLSIVDPLGSKRRRLMIRLSASQPTAEPVVAERLGEVVALDPPAPPLPILFPFPAKLIVEFKPKDETTHLTLKIIEMSQGQELYRHEASLDGDTWASGAVVLKTSYASASFSFAVRQLVLSGFPTGERLGDNPWQN